MYTVVMVMLNREMKCLQGDFDKEIRSVNGQFLVYLIAYVLRCTVVIPLEISKLYEVLGP